VQEEIADANLMKIIRNPMTAFQAGREIVEAFHHFPQFGGGLGF